MTAIYELIITCVWQLLLQYRPFDFYSTMDPSIFNPTQCTVWQMHSNFRWLNSRNISFERLHFSIWNLQPVSFFFGISNRISPVLFIRKKIYIKICLQKKAHTHNVRTHFSCEKEWKRSPRPALIPENLFIINFTGASISSFKLNI